MKASPWSLPVPVLVVVPAVADAFELAVAVLPAVEVLDVPVAGAATPCTGGGGIAAPVKNTRTDLDAV